jgi:hypothetical protein
MTLKSKFASYADAGFKTSLAAGVPLPHRGRHRRGSAADRGELAGALQEGVRGDGAVIERRQRSKPAPHTGRPLRVCPRPSPLPPTRLRTIARSCHDRPWNFYPWFEGTGTHRVDVEVVVFGGRVTGEIAPSTSSTKPVVPGRAVRPQTRASTTGIPTGSCQARRLIPVARSTKMRLSRKAPPSALVGVRGRARANCEFRDPTH